MTTANEPCRHCRGHPRTHGLRHNGEPRRGHEYEPMSWPIEAACGRCGREARLWPYGLVCPVCSNVAALLREPAR
jgi:hypothetical protein